MDKYEYKIRSDEIKTLIEKGDYAQAAEIADTIDWRRVKSVMTLCTISDLYKINRRYEDAKNMLILAYERRPGGRTICYSLCELCIKTGDLVPALKYLNEFVQAAPKDPGRYILQYKLYEAQEVRLEERVSVLEELKKRDYREKWAYELAYLYHRIGLATRCVEECDELILWFGEGKYVVKAMELKMLHQPLTPAQQEIYDHRFDTDVRQEVPLEETQEAIPEEEIPQEAPEGEWTEPGNGDAPEGQPGEMDIQVKTMDVGRYNTINLQAELAAGLQEVLGANDAARAEAQAAVQNGMYQEVQGDESNDLAPETGEMETEVFFGATGEIEEMPEEEFYVEEEEEQEETAGETAEEIIKETIEKTIEETGANVPAGRERQPEFVKKTEDGPQEQTDVRLEGQIPGRLGDRVPGRQEGQLPDRTGEQAGVRPADAVSAALQAFQEERAGSAEKTMAAPGGLADVLSLEAGGQMSIVLPENAPVEKQITGQMKIEDILTEWERMKKESEEKCKEEVRERVLRQTGPMFTEFEASVRDGLLEHLEQDAPLKDTAAGAEAKAEEPVNMPEEQLFGGQLSAESPGYDAGDRPMQTAEAPEPLYGGAASAERARLGAEAVEPLYGDVAEEGQYAGEPEALYRNAKTGTAADLYGEAGGSENSGGEASEAMYEDAAGEETLYGEAEAPGPLYGDAASPERASLGAEAVEPLYGDVAEEGQYAGESGALYRDAETSTAADLYGEAGGYGNPGGEASEAMYEDAAGEETLYGEAEVPEPLYGDAASSEQASLGAEAAEALYGDAAEEGQYAEAPEEAEGWQEKTEFLQEENIPGNDAIEEAGEIQEQSKKDEKPRKADTDRIRGNYDRSVMERDKAKSRSLTREEKELFSPFIQNRRSREQLVKALDNISMAAYTGNVIITGEEGMDTLTLAQNMMREVKMTDSNFSGRTAKITGQGLNRRNVGEVLEQMNNGALIIEAASGMNAETASALHRALQQERLGIIVILVDTQKALKKLFLGTPDLYNDFTARMDMEALSNDTLVSFGRQYAREMEYAIDDLGVLALHTRIEELQTIDHVVTVMEVKQIVDEAIHHACRKTLGHFFDVLLARRYDDEDMIILTEKDFVA